MERPAKHWGYIVNGVAFARGTLVAVAPEVVDFARSLAPALHRHAIVGTFLGSIRREAIRIGLAESLTISSGSICWALSTIPPTPVLPVGLRFETVSAEWLNTRIPDGLFPNGAGPSDGSGARALRNRFGIAVLDQRDEPLALAGVFDTHGLGEIGVDVLNSHQGLGLGRAVVAAAIHEILRREQIPFYGCDASNIRSQRLAWSSGFVPVCSDGAVS